MTVAELVEELKKLPQDARVVAGEAPNYAYVSDVDSVYLLPDRAKVGPKYGHDFRYDLNGCVEILTKG